MKRILQSEVALAIIALSVILLPGAYFFISDHAGAQGWILQTRLRVSICGNAITDSDETCDDGQNLGVYGSTTAGRSCKPGCMDGYGPYCGDGILHVRFGEQCDDGNVNPYDLCSLNCQILPAAPPSSIGSPKVGTTPPVQDGVPGEIPGETPTKVVLRGKAYPFSLVSILLDGKRIGGALADANADFVFSTTDITPGTASFSFLAKDRFGTDSMILTTVFDVVEAAVTSVTNVFLPPTIVPSEKQVEPGALITLKGQTVPTANVFTQLTPGKHTLLGSSADQNGDWALQIDTSSFPTGDNFAKSYFSMSSSTKSGYGRSVTFTIGTAAAGACGGKPDMNGDGKVNLVDFSIFLISWGTTESKADYNCDQKVNLADFSIMLFNWTG